MGWHLISRIHEYGLLKAVRFMQCWHHWIAWLMRQLLTKSGGKQTTVESRNAGQGRGFPRCRITQVVSFLRHCIKCSPHRNICLPLFSTTEYFRWNTCTHLTRKYTQNNNFTCWYAFDEIYLSFCTKNLCYGYFLGRIFKCKKVLQNWEKVLYKLVHFLVCLICGWFI